MAKRTGKKHLVLIRLKIEAKKQNQELVLYAKISAVTVFPAFNWRGERGLVKVQRPHWGFPKTIGYPRG